MKFAIRDDDTSYFTKPEELESAYDFIRGGTVSLSVVPFTVPHHEKGVLPYGEGIPDGYYGVGDNHALVEYLRHNPSYDLLLHGYSHEYQQIDGQWYPEMRWKDEDRIRQELTKGKAYLESVFDVPMRVFAAPNNTVDQRTIRTLEALSLNFSGIINHRDRDFSLQYVKNYVARWGYRIRTGLRIPDVLDYGRHKELVAYRLDSFDRLVEEYRACKKRNAPFTVYTHYWTVNRNGDEKRLLKSIYDYVTDDGAILTGLSDCFDN